MTSTTFGDGADSSLQLIGESAAIRQLHDDLRQAGRWDAKILITGESGVGKEIAARLVHSYSARRSRPFCAINCSGVADSLLESELFGHARGSFTGAYRDKTGIIEQADGGTLFMDEVGETSLRMQAALLRFLENGEIQPVGASRHGSSVNVRVIAATNRVLLDCVSAREFRADLYYRLNVIHLVVPPLRDRREDIEPLLRYFLQTVAGRYRTAPPEISRETLNALARYEWPGNVRELRNVAERILVHGCGAALKSQGIPMFASPAAAPSPPSRTPETSPSNQPARESDGLFERIVNNRESFWPVVYNPFMRRDLTRADVRAVVIRGLEQTRGSYKALVPLFNMAPQDYKRFLQFLHTHRCFTPFEDYRSVVRHPSISPAAAPVAAHSWANPSPSAAPPSL